MMKVYLAGPIDRVSEGDAKMWRDEASTILQGMGCLPIDPMRGKSRPYLYSDAEIDNRDIWDVYQSDIVLAYLPPEQVTYGTFVEIGLARAWRKLLVVVGDPRTPLVRHYAVRCFETLAEALGWLEKEGLP